MVIGIGGDWVGNINTLDNQNKTLTIELEDSKSAQEGGGIQDRT